MPLDHATVVVAGRSCDPGRVCCEPGLTRESWVRGEVVARDGTPDPASFRALGLGVLYCFLRLAGRRGRSRGTS